MRKAIRPIVLGGLVGILLGLGAVCMSRMDRTPYGVKSSFPTSFYGRPIVPEDLNPELKKAYFEGYVEDRIIIDVLDGRMPNTLFKPKSIEAERRY